MTRGSNVSLTRELPHLTAAVLGVQWSAGSDPALAENLQYAAILCDAEGAASSSDDFVFFNQVVSADLSVARLEAVLGDDEEQIEVHLPDVPAAVHRIVVVLYVNEGSPRRRTLGQLRECRVRVLDGATDQQIVRSVNLAETFGAETAVVLGELYRHRDDWKFKVVGQGYSAGLAGIADQYGLPL
jgi:tellurium resistance protein TerD